MLEWPLDLAPTGGAGERLRPFVHFNLPSFAALVPLQESPRLAFLLERHYCGSESMVGISSGVIEKYLMSAEVTTLTTGM
jgi:hypothetical protein